MDYTLQHATPICWITDILPTDMRKRVGRCSRLIWTAISPGVKSVCDPADATIETFRPRAGRINSSASTGEELEMT